MIKIADDFMLSSAIEKIGVFRMKNDIRTLMQELVVKRLENGGFQWPRKADECQTITPMYQSQHQDTLSTPLQERMLAYVRMQ